MDLFFRDRYKSISKLVGVIFDVQRVHTRPEANLRLGTNISKSAFFPGKNIIGMKDSGGKVF